MNKSILIIISLFCLNAFAGEMNVKKPIKLPTDIMQGYKNKWKFSCTWTEKGECMTPDYAYQIVNETDGHPVRFGKQSIRIELRKGDCHQTRKGSYNDCKASPPAERHEFGMDYDDTTPIRGTTWHTYSLFLPENTPAIDSEWITMGQFHNLDYHKPPVNLDLVGKHFELVTRFLCIHPQKFEKKCYSDSLGNVRKKIIDTDQLFGQWNDFVFHGKWSTNVKKGFFKMWVNGTLVYHFVGRTVAPNDGTMFKFGIYRGEAPQNSKENAHIVYYDEIRFAKKSCKKLKLKNLGYSCTDLEKQTIDFIHFIEDEEVQEKKKIDKMISIFKKKVVQKILAEVGEDKRKDVEEWTEKQVTKWTKQSEFEDELDKIISRKAKRKKLIEKGIKKFK